MASTNWWCEFKLNIFSCLTFSFGIKYVFVSQFIFSYLNAKISDILRPVSENER